MRTRASVLPPLFGAQGKAGPYFVLLYGSFWFALVFFALFYLIKAFTNQIRPGMPSARWCVVRCVLVHAGLLLWSYWSQQRRALPHDRFQTLQRTRI